jgi:hypothetical protein
MAKGVETKLVQDPKTKEFSRRIIMKPEDIETIKKIQDMMDKEKSNFRAKNNMAKGGEVQPKFVNKLFFDNNENRLLRIGYEESTMPKNYYNVRWEDNEHTFYSKKDIDSLIEKGIWVERQDDIKFKMGGKVKFEDKVKAIKASLLKTKKVPTKVQKDYGKIYNSKEAQEAAKRIAGAMVKKNKMKKGGLVSDKPMFKKLMQLEDRAAALSNKAHLLGKWSKWNETSGQNFSKRWYKMVEKLRGWEGDKQGINDISKPDWIKYCQEQGIVEDYNFGDVLA